MKLSSLDKKQEIEFEIPEKYKKIAVNCSGGADSSILLYTVVDYLEKNNRSDTTVDVLTCANDLKGRWNARRSADVINFVIENTKTNKINSHYCYYRDVQDVKYFHEIEYRLLEEKKNDLIISGITSNPKKEAIVENSKGNLVNLADEALPVRNSNNVPTWRVSEGEYAYYTPFINVDKEFIAGVYSYYNLTNFLLPLTRSCESIESDPSNYDRPCGKCWWCLERKWAFGVF